MEDEKVGYTFCCGLVLTLEETVAHCQKTYRLNAEETTDYASTISQTIRLLIKFLATHPLYSQEHFLLKIPAKLNPKCKLSDILDEWVDHILTDVAMHPSLTAFSISIPDIVRSYTKSVKKRKLKVEDLFESHMRQAISPFVTSFVMRLPKVQKMGDISQYAKYAQDYSYCGKIVVPPNLSWERDPMEELALTTQDLDISVSPNADSEPMEPLEDSNQFTSLQDTLDIHITFGGVTNAHLKKSLRYTWLDGKRVDSQHYILYEGYGTLEKALGYSTECSFEFFPKDLQDLASQAIACLHECSHPNLVKLEFAMPYEGGTLLALERHSKSLFDIIKNGTMPSFIEDSNRNVLVFSDFLKNTIMELLKLVDYLIEREAFLDNFNCRDIVYLETCRGGLLSPKIRHCYFGQMIETNIHHHYCKLLRWLIIEIMNESCACFPSEVSLKENGWRQVSHEIEALAKYLNVDAPVEFSKTVVEHPAFWVETEHLQFLIDLRNRIRLGEITISGLDQLLIYDCCDWRDVIKENEPVLADYLDYSIKDRRRHIPTFEYVNSVSDLSAFFRHAYEHILEKRRKIKPEIEAELTTDRLANKLERYLQKNFPTFVAYVYTYLDSHNLAWRPFKRNTGI